MQDDLLKLARPLIEYLKANYDPHCKIEVEYDKVKVIRTEHQMIDDSQS